jgi:NADPH:quinone reductase-like Zn-dependent oxidoreductase
MNRVVRIHEHGGPEVLRIEEAAPQPPDAGEVLIRVAAFGLNNSEAQLRRGTYPMTAADLPTRIGRECCGTVEAVGPHVSSVQPGDIVCTIPAFDMKRNGVYGDWCTVPEAGVTPIPKGLTLVEGAAIWQQYLTAYGPLVLYGDVRASHTVLITAAASSVGLGAIQLAKLRGAKVIGTTRTAAKRDLLKQHGADHVIVPPDEPLADRVLQHTGYRGFDLCMDPVAGPDIAQLAACAARAATIFLYGQLSPVPSPLPLLDLLRKGLSIRGYTLWEITLDPNRRKRALDYIRRHIESGALRPIVDRVFRLDEIVAAHAYLESGRQAGKIVVKVEESAS